MNQAMNIVKLIKFNFLKKGVKKFGWQRKNLVRENRRLGHNTMFVNV